MKKTYINPEMEIVKIQTMQMLANSMTEVLQDTTVDEGLFDQYGRGDSGLWDSGDDSGLWDSGDDNSLI